MGQKETDAGLKALRVLVCGWMDRVGCIADVSCAALFSQQSSAILWDSDERSKCHWLHIIYQSSKTISKPEPEHRRIVFRRPGDKLAVSLEFADVRQPCVHVDLHADAILSCCGHLLSC